MAIEDLPTPETLRKLLMYDPETGLLTWMARTPDMFSEGKQSASHNAAIWNGRYAGKDALSVRHSEGYKEGAIFNRRHLAHRVIWAMVYGEWPEFVDHINGIRDDNRLNNLRSVSRQANMRNMARPANNTSGVVGVNWVQSRSKWVAKIKIDGKTRYLGIFASFQDAVACRQAASKANGYHENHGR